MSESENTTPDTDDYRVSKTASQKVVEAPKIDYLPPNPEPPALPIGLLGCGGIAATHLGVYREAQFPVTAVYDRHRDRARKLRDEFFPDAKLCESEREFFDADFVIADLTPHPVDRVELIRKALASGRHVLSQKPLAVDIADAKELIDLADSQNVFLAVNHNGRWAPHVAYARKAIEAGMLGEIQSVDISIHWDHNWCAGTPFDRVHHLLLYDFAIHWFDMLVCYLPEFRPRNVFAQLGRTNTQKAIPPLNGQVLIDFDSDEGKYAQTALSFRGDSNRCPLDRTIIVGSKATLVASGPNLNEQQVEIHFEDGVANPLLESRWFDDGFQGTMGELICSIQENRRPENHAETVLPTLEICFAAVESAETGNVVPVGSVTKLSERHAH